METILCSDCNIMDKETYLSDPCGASSLPFWKANAVPMPDDLLILGEGDPRLSEACKKHVDTPYFKLIHPMIHVVKPTLPDGFRFIQPDEKDLSEHITACYADIGSSADALATYKLHPTFSPDLWLAIIQKSTGEILASGIAELDTDIREGVLEWIQVTPKYRRMGWGRMIVCELLSRLQGRAEFVTVSGKANDPSCPRALYESCGFKDGVVWHVLRMT